MKRLLERIADQLREDILVCEEVLNTEGIGDALARCTRVRFETADCARRILVDDVDKVVSVLRKMK